MGNPAESYEVLIENELSREGTRTVHVMRMGAAPDQAAWICKLPICALDSLTLIKWKDAMEVHHLILTWNAREAMEFAVRDAPEEKVKGILWWMAGGQRMSEAIQEAAERYFLDYEKDAGVVVCRILPSGAPRADGQGRALPVRIGVLGREIELELFEAEWAPRKSVVLLGSKEEFECLSRG